MLPPTTRRRITVQQGRLMELIRPRVTWKELEVIRKEKSGIVLTGGVHFRSRKMAGVLGNSRKVICFIATVGSRIDREIASLMEGGALAHGYVADALGSGAVESLANSFHLDMAEMAARRNRYVGLRFSPGYCDWPVSDQHRLFSLLDHDAIGVELGDTSLMAPRKSISGVFGVFADKKGLPDITHHNPCLRCGRKNCIARRVDAVPPLSAQ